MVYIPPPLPPPSLFLYLYLTQPPFVQKTIKHGELPIWLHANCMLFTPECFVEYHPEAESSSSTKPTKEDSKASGTTNTATSSKKKDAGSSSKSGASGKGGSGSGDVFEGMNKGGSRAVYFGVDEARKRVALKCTSCTLQGALIGCHVSSCQVNTHYACAVREGWKFGDEPDADGKVIYT